MKEKPFFQNYIKSIYGSRRVFLINMVKRSENIFHVLTKQSLVCKDIFLFNLAKSFPAIDSSFEALEAIKDGHALSSKYNSTKIKFKIPNTIMVFSNNYPHTSALSSDRWLIFGITNDNLVKKGYQSNQNSHYVNGKLVKNPYEKESGDDSDSS